MGFAARQRADASPGGGDPKYGAVFPARRGRGRRSNGHVGGFMIDTCLREQSFGSVVGLPDTITIDVTCNGRIVISIVELAP